MVEPAEYAKHLESVHAGWAVAPELLATAVGEVSHNPIRNVRRIVAGEANEVYELRVVGGLELIVRISRDADKHFEQERWAIDQCRRVGVPCPNTLLIRLLSTPGMPLDLCIQERAPGGLPAIPR